METEFGPASYPSDMTHPSDSCKAAFCRHVSASDFKFRMRSFCECILLSVSASSCDVLALQKSNHRYRSPGGLVAWANDILLENLVHIDDPTILDGSARFPIFLLLMIQNSGKNET